MAVFRYFLVFLILLLFLTSFSQGCMRRSLGLPPTPGVTPPPPPMVQTVNIGETAAHGNLRIILRGYSFQDTINGFAPGADQTDYHWVVLDLSVENVDTAREVSLWPGVWDPPWSMTDSDGYSYHAYGYSGLEHSFDGTHILPGETRRGNALVAVPRDATGLSFRYDFGGGNIAVFPLK